MRDDEVPCFPGKVMRACFLHARGRKALPHEFGELRMWREMEPADTASRFYD